MLYEKNTSLKSKVATFKLLSGEEIIAKVVQDDGPSFLVSTPLSMVMIANPDAPEQGMVSFAPWMLALPDHQVIALKKDHILFCAEARQDAAEQYNLATKDMSPPQTNDMLAGQKQIVNGTIVGRAR